MTRRASDTVATVQRLAKVFDAFELKYEEETRSWRCRNPANGYHWFRLYFAPGVVFMWGDIGEFVWSVNDSNALEWYLGQGAQEGDYPDYFLGKLRAVSGEAGSTEFYVGDAYAYIDERVAEIRAEWDELVEGMEPDSDDRHHAANDIANRKKPWEDVRSRFTELLEEQTNEERTCWYLAYTEAGFDDPPSCHGWTATALWSWYACKTFARLHAARAVPQPIDTEATTLTAEVPS